MKKAFYFFLFFLCLVFLWGCPQEIEDYIFSTIEWDGDVPQGIYRYPGTTSFADSATYAWDGDTVGISTVYVAEAITNISGSPNAVYIVVAPEAKEPDTPWHLQCWEKILSDLKAAKVSDPEKGLKNIVDAGNKKASTFGNEEQSFLQAPWKAKGLLPTPKAVFSSESKKPSTWGAVKNEAGR